MSSCTSSKHKRTDNDSSHIKNQQFFNRALRILSNEKRLIENIVDQIVFFRELNYLLYIEKCLI